jgi:hypothetical protein
VTLTNSGNTSLSVSSITASGNYSETDNCTSEPIPANGTCTISVTFLPTALGDILGTLTVNDNASNSPQTESLSGVGVPATLTATCADGSFIQGGLVPFFPVAITGIVIPASDSGPAVVHPDKPTGITSHCTLNTTLYPGLSNASAPGSYPNGLSPVVSGAPLANYIVVPVDGNLTINDTVIVARPVSKK